MYDEYRWFVVHTYSGYENKVCSNLLTVIENRGLQDMIPEVCIPTQTVVELREVKEKKTRKKKTDEEIAKEVLAGKWGSGDDRKARLKAAGYDYSAIQKIVNKLLS